MRDSIRLLRRALPLVSVAVIAAVAYDGWIFYSRWSSARETGQAGQAEGARLPRQTLDLIGGTDFRIIDFYASPQVIRRGNQARICFGVYGAKRVRIEPAVEDLHPAASYCLQVAPRKDTAYKLIAEDGAGHTATASGFFVPALAPRKTYRVTLSSSAGNSDVGTFRIDSSDVTAEPASLSLAPGQKQSLTFTLTHAAPAGALLLDVTTDVPESVIMPEVMV